MVGGHTEIVSNEDMDREVKSAAGGKHSDKIISHAHLTHPPFLSTSFSWGRHSKLHVLSIRFTRHDLVNCETNSTNKTRVIVCGVQQ